MISNQFLGRAYLCQFQLLAPVGTTQLVSIDLKVSILTSPKNASFKENLDKCIPFLYKAIEFSKQNKRLISFFLFLLNSPIKMINLFRYNFLVYNASVLFWKYVRAFLKHRFKRYICSSLQFILNALNEIDDADYEWRATLTK